MIETLCICLFVATADGAERTRRIAELSDDITRKSGDLVDKHSERGDLFFQSGEFAKSLADYEKMIEINPRLDVTHWRKGIALYYLGRWDESARQFEKYQTIDDVDRENGLWRFLAMHEGLGTAKARAAMIQYVRVDRPPLTDVYRMFQGELTADDFRSRAEQFREHSKERFYADLYLGLFFDVEGKPVESLRHLKAAEDSRWAKEAGGGPGWMWHIARIHAEKVRKRESPKVKKDDANRAK
jgi:lipoprotein NlpI